MTELNRIEQDNEGVNYYFFIAFCIIIALVFIWSYAAGLLPVNKGELVDTDCYMHLIRAADLYDTGNWYYPALIKSNTPYGEISHWTRPFDVLLLLGAVPASVFVDFRTALFGWGVVLSPVLLVFTLVALNWATRPLLSRDGTFLVILLFLSQTVTMGAFLPARSDHHGLMAFLYVVSLGLALRMIVNPFRRSLCYMAGGISALSLWCLIEAFIPVCVIMGVLVLLWIIQEGDFLRKGFHYSVSLLLFCGLCLILENPPAKYFAVIYDRFSIIHVTIFSFMALFWIIAYIWRRSPNSLQKCLGRVIYTLSAALAGVSVVLFIFPKLAKGPLADIDPEVISLWFNSIGEMKPLLSESISLLTSVQILGTFFVCLPFLVYMLWWDAKISDRNGWIYIMVSSIIFSLLLLFRVRWAMYAQILFSVIMTELLCRVRNRIKSDDRALWRAIKNIAVTLFFVFGFLCLGAVAERVFKRDDLDGQGKAFSLVKMCKYLNDVQHINQPNLRILTNLNYAGEILYRTPYEVLGSNYHRNSDGIIDTYNLMTADVDEKAFEILRKRRIDIILICPEQPELFDNVRQAVTSTFYQRLCSRQLPCWLSEIQLPEELSENFLLFKTNFKNLENENKIPTQF